MSTLPLTLITYGGPSPVNGKYCPREICPFRKGTVALAVGLEIRGIFGSQHRLNPSWHRFATPSPFTKVRLWIRFTHPLLCPKIIQTTYARAQLFFLLNGVWHFVL